uniref:Uncharacterized protein n=1 Tax=Streptomyces sp. NBC_00093 TaxID=2975649 RepID=A0AAU2A4J3_9ACTN
MGIANAAHVAIFLADYANTDPSGKINAVGAGWQMVAMTEAGHTVPYAVVVLISVPPSVEGGTEIDTTLTLCDASEQIVQLPSPTGEAQPIQLQQTIKLDRPKTVQFTSHDKLWSQGKVIVNLPNGLPLTVESEYKWVFAFDGADEPHWIAPFFVMRPQQMQLPAPPEPDDGQS